MRCYYPEGVRRQLYALLSTTDLTQKELSKIQCPTLIMHGDEDPLIPIRAGLHLATCISGARWKLLPGMGHDINSHNDTRIGDLILDHLDRTPSNRCAEGQSAA